MTEQNRSLRQVLAKEEPYERCTLTRFQRYTNDQGEERAELGFDTSGITAPLHAVAKDWTPAIGSPVLLFGKGFGYAVRGIVVDYVLLYYRTEEEEQAAHEARVAADRQRRLDEYEHEGKAKRDAEYAALPPIFQARIDKFRRNNPDFRVEYEGYEMFCCTEAVKLARHLGTVEAAEHYAALTRDVNILADEAKWHAEWEEQKAIDRAAGMSRDHSGNTHGTAVALAFWFLKQPTNVELMHGALAPLVGSEEYGCIPKSA